MPPVERFVCRFAAEPPQEGLPYGAWAQTLQAEFLAACLRIETEGEELGEAGDLRFFPDRTWNGRTYVPVTAPTSTGLELFGYVSFVRGEYEPGGLRRRRPTSPTRPPTATPSGGSTSATRSLGTWRGDGGRTAEMTLVWGVPLVGGGAGRHGGARRASPSTSATSVEDRFTLRRARQLPRRLPRRQALGRRRARARLGVALRRRRGRRGRGRAA